MPLPCALLESLESRTLFSISPFLDTGHAGPQTPIGGIVKTPLLRKGIGHDITAIAGTASTVEVAFFPSPVLDPPMAFSASIDWGDGTTSTATLTYTTENGKGGYQIVGTHTYAAARTFKLSTVVVESPIPSTTGPSATPIRLVSRIASKAVVSAAGAPTGIVLGETTNASFTAGLGSFTSIVPTKGLKTTILWGDGQSSAATLTPTDHGIDTVTYQVTGTHSYAQAGIYTIQANITSTRPHVPIPALDSSAVVTAPQSLNLAGTITGSFTQGVIALATTGLLTPIPFLNGDLTGAGTAGALGNVSLSGTLFSGGPIIVDPPGNVPTGTLTLTNTQGSLTLLLTASNTITLATNNASYLYSFESGTGACTNVVASGTAVIAFNSTTVTIGTSTTFTLTLT